MTAPRSPMRRRVLRTAAPALSAMSAGVREAGLVRAFAVAGGVAPVAVVAAGTASAQPQTQPMQPQPMLSGTLRAALQDGGCVLLLRHARTEPGIGDPPGFRLADCPTQRNLSDEGRAQSRALGEALRRGSVAIGAVRASRWCRCLDTATLAFGRVEPWPVLDSFFAERRTEPAQTAALQDWIRRFRGPGNAALVTHQVNITALTGEGVGMGEGVVLRPVDAGFRLIGRFGG